MVPRKVRRALKRQGRLVAFFLVLLLGGLSLWQAWDVITHLQRQARETSEMYGEVLTALGDPGAEATALLNLAQRITESGIGVIPGDRPF